MLPALNNFPYFRYFWDLIDNSVYYKKIDLICKTPKRQNEIRNLGISSN